MVTSGTKLLNFCNKLSAHFHWYHAVIVCIFHVVIFWDKIASLLWRILKMFKPLANLIKEVEPELVAMAAKEIINFGEPELIAFLGAKFPELPKAQVQAIAGAIATELADHLQTFVAKASGTVDVQPSAPSGVGSPEAVPSSPVGGGLGGQSANTAPSENNHQSPS